MKIMKILKIMKEKALNPMKNEKKNGRNRENEEKKEIWSNIEKKMTDINVIKWKKEVAMQNNGENIFYERNVMK